MTTSTYTAPNSNGHLEFKCVWGDSTTTTSVSIAPNLYRWDDYSVYASASYTETLTEPNGSTGSWSFSKRRDDEGGSWQWLDNFGTRTYSRKASAYTVTLNLGYTAGTSWSSDYHYLSGTAPFTLTVPALPSYTITYKANYGSVSDVTQSKQHGTSVTIKSASTFTRSGYVFNGWNTKSDGSGTSYAAGATYSTDAAITLYAQWLAQYTISYNANGHGTAPSSQTKTQGVAITLQGAMATTNSYVFKNWNTNSGGTGTTYAAGASYTEDAALSLYAQWYAPYTITPNANGGTLKSGCSALTKAHGTNITIWASSLNPTRTNYVFKNWNTSSDGTGTSYAAGASYTSNAGTVLYAQWYAPYTVTYDANGGTGAPSAGTKVYNSAYTVSSTVPTRTGYAFDGWNTASAGNGTSYTSGSTIAASVNKNITLYAQWHVTHANPTISNFLVQRCDTNGNLAADGTRCKITASISVDYSTTGYTDTKLTSVTVKVGSNTAETVTIASGQTSASISFVSANTVAITSTYSVKITATDSKGFSSSLSSMLSVAFFTMHFSNGGKGMGIGEPAPTTGLKIGMDTTLDGKVYVDNGGQTIPFYGTSSTEASTQAKVVTCTAFTSSHLVAGTIIYVKFTNGQTYNGAPTLNINSTGAKGVRRYGNTVTPQYWWVEDEVVGFVYDGTYWLTIKGGLATTTSWGYTRLEDSVSSTLRSRAATPNSVKTAYDKAVSAYDLADGKLSLTGGTMTGFITRKSDTLDLTAADNGLTSAWNPSFLCAKDKNDNNMMMLQCYAHTSGYTYTQLDARNNGTGSAVNNYLRLRVDNDGTRKIVVPDGKPWRDGIGIGYGSGTITKVYTNNGFTVEITSFYYSGNTVTVPIKFSSTTAFSGNGTTIAASIPADYAPPTTIVFPLFTTDGGWSTYTVGCGILSNEGKIMFWSKSAQVWFGTVTYVRDY